MKKLLLSILSVVGISALSFGQSVTMEVGASGDISGTQIDYTAPEVAVNIRVVNTSGDSMDLDIKRLRINPQPNWLDVVCWTSEANPLEGVCYQYETTNPWTTQITINVANGEAGLLTVHIYPEDYGCVVYRYYVMDGTTALDSIDINVCKTADLEDLKPALTVSVAPNPANSHVTVKTSGVDAATVKMVDVLGNIVLKETVIGSSKTINISEFRNGIYFIAVEAKEAKTVTRKIIVRH